MNIESKKVEYITDEKSIRKLLNRARNYARQKGYQNDADDFAQEYYIARSRGRQGTIGQIFIDYLRGYYGDTRAACGHVRANERISRLSFDDPISTSIRRPLNEYIGSFRDPTEFIGPSWRDRIYLGRGSSKSNSEIKEVILSEDLEQYELAKRFRLSPPRISQINKELKKDIKMAQSLNEIDEYTDFKEKSQLKINWITL